MNWHALLLGQVGDRVAQEMVNVLKSGFGGGEGGGV